MDTTLTPHWRLELLFSGMRGNLDAEDAVDNGPFRTLTYDSNAGTMSTTLHTDSLPDGTDALEWAMHRLRLVSNWFATHAPGSKLEKMELVRVDGERLAKEQERLDEFLGWVERRRSGE